jgi:tripeptidyl-peptidase-1
MQTGRGYPDVSAQGGNLALVMNGQPVGIGGTSASSPVFAAAAALVNEQLLANGKKPLGFLKYVFRRCEFERWQRGADAARSPLLYAHPEALNDITSGQNPDPKCHNNGFPAAAGWDPVRMLARLCPAVADAVHR